MTNGNEAVKKKSYENNYTLSLRAAFSALFILKHLA